MPNLCFLTEAFAVLHFHNVQDTGHVEQAITNIIDPNTDTPDVVMIADGLFNPGAQPHLIGGQHRETKRIVFPCPVGDPRFDAVDLPRRGRIWSWTVQRFRPKTPPYIGPEAFEPFAIGYVELPGAVIVETRLTDIAFDAICIGMAVETVILPVAIDAAGRTVTGYAFAPVSGDDAHV